MKLAVSSSAVTAVASVLFSSSFVAGQTFTDCNPLKKSEMPRLWKEEAMRHGVAGWRMVAN